MSKKRKVNDLETFCDGIGLTKKDFYLPNRVMLCKIGKLSDPRWKANLIHISYITDGKHTILIFPATVSRCKRTFATLSMFSSGKLIGTGCREKINGLYSARILLYTLSEQLGIDDLYISEFSTPNIVGSVRLGCELDLDLMRKTYIKHVTTKNLPVKESPFPGMTVYVKDEQWKNNPIHWEIPPEEWVSYIAFKNGYINITGMITDEQVVLDRIIDRCFKFFLLFKLSG